MHGSADFSGAPRGNQNAVTHGYFTAKAKQQRKELSMFLEHCLDPLALSELLKKGEFPWQD